MPPFQFLHRLFAAVVNRLFPPRRRWALIYGSNLSGRRVNEIRRRFSFYMPDWDLRECDASGGGRLATAWMRRVPVLYSGRQAMDSAPVALRDNPRYWLNPFEDMNEAWQWQGLVHDFSGEAVDLDQARKRLIEFIDRNRLREYKRCYVLGTGPSLEKAIARDWSDGARVVCNTIVRDKELWHHVKPHILFAGDAAYHYSFAGHACAFRDDLKKRLHETETLFLYPSEFDAFVRREFSCCEDALVPVPKGMKKQLDIDLTRDFEFGNFHNVLPRLLTIACTLCEEVGLWGFDGRAPGAEGFWKNSPRHTYPEFMEELREAYPAFFEELVPERDGTKYIRMAFGDELDECLSQAEARGKRFVMMHETWTGTLKKRIV